MTRPIAFLLTLAGLLSASEVQAGHKFLRGGSHRGIATTTSYPSGDHSVLPGSVPGYSGSGYNDFPFYGHSYGHPYDRWTWPHMSGAYGQGLARYYDPPVK